MRNLCGPSLRKGFRRRIPGEVPARESTALGELSAGTPTT